MSEIVYVSGHKNPDTDSICSAIAYSYLLNATNKYNAVPVRLGEVNRETEYVLKRFGVEHPVLLKTVKQKVEDLNYDKVTVFSKDLTLKTAWFLLKQQNLKSAPILDEHGQLLGLLSTSNIIEGYMDQWDSEVLKKAKTPVENVIDTLEANVIYLNEALKVINGDIHIAAMSGNEAKKRIHENDVVIVGGDRSDDLEELISVKPSLIILTGSLTSNGICTLKGEKRDRNKRNMQKKSLTFFFLYSMILLVSHFKQLKFCSMKLNAFVLPFAAENIFHNTGRHFYDYRTETTFNRRNYYTCRKYGQKPGTRHTHRPRYRDDDHRMYRRYNADRPTTL